MSLLDIVRAAVPAVAAARVGELQGEREVEERARKRGFEDAALERQSRLDQMKAQLDQATQERERAEADYYRRRPAPGTATSTAAPHTLSTDSGIMVWDPVSKKFKPTGFQPPERATDRAAARQASKDKAQSTKDALSGVGLQIRDTRAQIVDAPKDPSLPRGAPGDSIAASRIAQLRQRLDSLSGVSDSLNSVLKGGHPGPVKRAISADQAAYLRESKGMTDAQIQAKYRVTP
jgi:hypothetical protein